jgi:hypothetical protein
MRVFCIDFFIILRGVGILGKNLYPVNAFICDLKYIKDKLKDILSLMSEMSSKCSNKLDK